MNDMVARKSSHLVRNRFVCDDFPTKLDVILLLLIVRDLGLGAQAIIEELFSAHYCFVFSSVPIGVLIVK